MKFRACLACIVAYTGLAGNAVEASGWPAVKAPEPTTSVAQQMSLNGMPMRIHTFVSTKSVDEIVDFYRQEWGTRHVENKVKAATVLGRATGEFYTTVQIVPQPAGSRVIIAVARLGAMASSTPAAKFHPPVTSRLLSDMESADAGKSARHLVYANKQSPRANRDRLIEAMKEKGYVLEQEGQAKDEHGTALFFRGEHKEAIAVVSRIGDGTSVVLNTVTELENSR